ncbi:MAG: serine/threonine protein kinase [Candidatus Schekmanbacteria bacterium]|nr:serine/threonine protein kinase [Candidatus Schekmanbacteria bacterium]
MMDSSSREAAAAFPTGPRLADRFTCIRVLGRGSFGTVYLACDGEDQSMVAVKHLRPAVLGEYPEEDRRRFLREAKALRQLRHPGIVRLIDLLEINGHLYMITEFVDGTGLDRVIAGRAPLAEPEACRIAYEALEALSAVHDAGMLHRDLKPANLMLDKSGRVRLLDFGMAKPSDRSWATQTGQIMGTVRYMSPERFAGEEGRESDIFGMGVILYELLTGKTPFQCETLAQMLQLMATNTRGTLPVPARPLSPGLWPTLDRACAHQAQSRFADCRGFMAALRPYAFPETALEADSFVAAVAAGHVQPGTRSERDVDDLAGRQLALLVLFESAAAAPCWACPPGPALTALVKVAHRLGADLISLGGAFFLLRLPQSKYGPSLRNGLLKALSPAGAAALESWTVLLAEESVVRTEPSRTIARRLLASLSPQE